MSTVNVNLNITTANVPDSTDRRYVNDAQKTVIENTSGTNTGDQDLSGYLQKSGYIMDVNAKALFAGAIDIQSNGVTDYSKSWYYGDDVFAQMGFGANHYLNATASLIELVALAPNSIYQVIADSASENSRMVANKNGALAEFIVNPGLPAIYRNTANHPINYFNDPTSNLTDLSIVPKSYVDNQLSAAAVAQLKDQGNYDASSNLFPSVANIKTGFLWTISVGGTLGGVNVTTGDVVRALTDSPGQTASNWNITENNIGYVPENNANKVQDFSDPTSVVKFPVVKAVVDYIVSALASFKTTNFLDATSSIQTQLDSKAVISTASGTIIVTSGTSFTTPSNITTSTVFYIELIGGGGGGAGRSTTNLSGSGGGGGGYCFVKVTGLSPSTTYTCSIGVGGAGGADASNGTDGGDTTLTIGATTYTASGGIKGLTAASSNGGAGGTGTNGDINITGQNGSATGSTGSVAVISSEGGNSPKGWGHGGNSTFNSPGANGTGYGGGGSSAKGAGANAVGGNGSNGIIYCKWFN